MSNYINTKNTDDSQNQVTPLDEKRKLASIALKRVDQLIKTKEYQQALLETAHVKEIDRTNVYAFALEERIKGLQIEDIKVQQQKVNLTVDQTPKSITKLDISTLMQSQADCKYTALHATPSTDIQFNQPSLKTYTQVIQKPVEIRSVTLTSSTLKTNEKSIEPIKWMPKVLIIDDDVNLLSVLRMTIESGGYEVIALSTSDEAYTLLRKFVPDVILCDINLETSTMGGFSFFEKVREIENIKHVPFIFLSGLTDDVLIRTGKEMGVDDYLTKPIKGQNLLAAIRGKIKRFGELGIKPSTSMQGSIASIAYSGILS